MFCCILYSLKKIVKLNIFFFLDYTQNYTGLRTEMNLQHKKLGKEYLALKFHKCLYMMSFLCFFFFFAAHLELRNVLFIVLSQHDDFHVKEADSFKKAFNEQLKSTEKVCFVLGKCPFFYIASLFFSTSSLAF